MAAAGATEGVFAGRAGRDRTGRAGRKALRTLAVMLAAPLIAGLLAGCGSSLVKSALVAHTVQEDAAVQQESSDLDEHLHAFLYDNEVAPANEGVTGG